MTRINSDNMKKKILSVLSFLAVVGAIVIGLAILGMRVIVDEPIKITAEESELDVYPGETYTVDVTVKNLANATHSILFELEETVNDDGIQYEYTFSPAEKVVLPHSEQTIQLSIYIETDSPIGILAYNVVGIRQKVE